MMYLGIFNYAVRWQKLASCAVLELILNRWRSTCVSKTYPLGKTHYLTL